MALTKTDKDEIARIARKEIKDFMSKPQFKNEIQKVPVTRCDSQLVLQKKRQGISQHKDYVTKNTS